MHLTRYGEEVDCIDAVDCIEEMDYSDEVDNIEEVDATDSPDCVHCLFHDGEDSGLKNEIFLLNLLCIPSMRIFILMICSPS